MWAIATDLSVAAVILAVTTLAIEWALRLQAGYTVSRRLLFVTLTATGWAPALGIHPLFASSGLAFLAVLVLVRWTAARSPRRDLSVGLGSSFSHFWR
ncbi:MAG TPA: hypothetical protein VE984_10790 [Gaiellaceae bacterium]|nr:hypothetical protein [Gaiellaceae bacterium]